MLPPEVAVRGGGAPGRWQVPYGPRRHDFGPPGRHMPGCFSNLGNDCPEAVGEMRTLIVKMVLAPLNCVFDGPIRYFVRGLPLYLSIIPRRKKELERNVIYK